MRKRRPAARRHGVQCWHGGPRDPVWQFVGPRNAADCLAAQKEPLGLVAHTHVAAAFQEGARRPHKIVPGEPLELTGKWLLNPGAVCAERVLAARSTSRRAPPPGTARPTTRHRPCDRARALGSDGQEQSMTWFWALGHRYAAARHRELRRRRLERVREGASERPAARR